MKEITPRVEALTNDINRTVRQLNIDKLQTELARLNEESQAADFWSNNLVAQSVMKQIATLESRIKPWADIRQDLKDVSELLATNDESLQIELSSQIDELFEKVESQKELLKFSGPYDDHDAIISIYAGAGGTDAQDWTQMLYRMYVRWAEQHNAKVNLIEESSGEEAGLKSVTMSVEMGYAYGNLMGENGVHRLVRLSPFNSDNLRQTSFAKVDVMPKIDKPNEIDIDEKDLKIDVYRSGGKGGQSVNTTDSAVRITHLPTNIVVAIQNERSQLQNKETAMTILRSKLARLQTEQHVNSLRELKGPNEQAAWGNQIRNYVLHPYKQVKDLRSKFESTDPDAVLDGHIDPFISAYLATKLGQK